MDIHTGTGRRAFVARIPARTELAHGGGIRLGVRMEEAHWFESGKFGKFGRSLIDHA
jgi:hypothetical protein